jgi:LPXTG-motif cell wall-anchored protein
MKKCLIYLLIIIFCFGFPNLIFANTNVKEIDISTSPHKVLFDINNAKPGDTFTKVLKVESNGGKDFNYLFSNRFLTGSEKFYESLILSVTDNLGEIYNGKLIDFEKLAPRVLKSGTKEELSFNIYFPYELGNDYQGLSCEFEFKFYVEGTIGGVLPADGPKLPNTGSDMFNILVVGAVLVLTGSTLQFFVKRRNKLDKQV